MLNISSKLGFAVTPESKLGIENIKEAFTVTITLATGIIELIKDFSYQKAFQLAFQLAEYKSLVPVFKASLAEFADLDTREAKDLQDHFKQEFDIENDKLETVIENSIGLIVRTYEFIVSGVKIFTDWKQFAREVKDIFPSNGIATSKAA